MEKITLDLKAIYLYLIQTMIELEKTTKIIKGLIYEIENDGNNKQK